MKRKRLLLIFSGFFIGIIIVVSFTYAYMQKGETKKETKSTIKISACAKIQMLEQNQTINLQNTYPMEDNLGLMLPGYKFTVKSTCESYVGFNLYFSSLKTNTIADTKIHYAITDKQKKILKEGIVGKENDGSSDFTDQEKEELEQGVKGEVQNIYQVFSNAIPWQGESEYIIYLWVDKDAGNETMKQTYQLGVSLKAVSRKETLAEYIIKNKDNSLIYHDGKPDYADMPNYTEESGDYSYRYSGANPNNYVCFGGNCTSDPSQEGYQYLYRIIGLFKNELNLYEIKLIKADYATVNDTGNNAGYEKYSEYSPYLASLVYDSTNYRGDKENYYNQIGVYYWNSKDETYTDNWANSELNMAILNGYYWQNLEAKWQQLVADHSWQISGGPWNDLYQLNLKKFYDQEQGVNQLGEKYSKNKIGLMYVSDYGYAASPEVWNLSLEFGVYNKPEILANNWLYQGLWEATITPVINDFPGYLIVLDTNGALGAYPGWLQKSAIRPSLYLNFQVQFQDGLGTSDQPYIIN